MPVHSKFEEKVDVLDLIINVLKDHEEALAGIIEKFDETRQKMDAFVERLSMMDKVLERLGRLKVKNIVEAVGINGHLVEVKCKDWAAFRAASQGALLVTFEVSEGEVTISSVTDLFVFTYSDGIPEPMGMVSEGAARWMRRMLKDEEDVTLFCLNDEAAYEVIVNSETLRKWLSSELEMPEDKIVHGRVLC